MESKTKRDIKIIDIFCLIMGIFWISVAIISHTEPPKNLEYVPDAIKGLTTLASILVGFTGFSMTYTISIIKEEETKKWLKQRTGVATILIGIGLLILIMAYGELVNGDLSASYYMTFISLGIILLLFLDTILLLRLLTE
jgi:amino acid transporter